MKPKQFLDRIIMEQVKKVLTEERNRTWDGFDVQFEPSSGFDSDGSDFDYGKIKGEWGTITSIENSFGKTFQEQYFNVRFKNGMKAFGDDAISGKDLKIHYGTD